MFGEVLVYSVMVMSGFFLFLVGSNKVICFIFVDCWIIGVIDVVVVYVVGLYWMMMFVCFFVFI